jgi:drug/metabolite transporter (DMT)-like permease
MSAGADFASEGRGLRLRPLGACGFSLVIPVGLDARKHGPHAPIGAWAAFSCTGVVSLLFAFWGWYRGAAPGGVARVSQVQLPRPFPTIESAWASLGERIGPSTNIAATMVALGQQASIARAI